MPKKIWVNLQGGDPAKDEGRLVVLKIKATETMPGASKDQPIYAFVKPDGGNEANKFLPVPDRPTGFEKKPPVPMKATIRDQKAEIWAMLSVRGGDKFNLEFGKDKDGGDKKPMSGDGFEVWRKVFFRVGKMKGMRTRDVMQLQGKFDPVFIQLEKEGGETEIDCDPFGGPPAPYITAMQAKAGVAKWPDQTVDIVFADRLFTRGQKDIVVRKNAGQIPDALHFTVPFSQKNRATGSTEQYFTWPDRKAWLKDGMIYLRDNTGREIAAQPAHPYVTPFPSGTYFEHPEGYLTNTLYFDLAAFPGIKDWKKDQNNTMKITLGIYNFDGAAAGKADPSTGGILVATRSPRAKDGTPPDIDGLADGTVLHEMGHSLGHVLKWIFTYSEDDASVEDKVQNQYWYEAKGGVGNHCYQGSTDKGSKVEAGSKPCVMFHGTAPNTTDFCENCQRILKRARLSKLGRVNVWGNAGWK